MKRIARLYAMAIALAAVAVPCVSAQDYYDDDLYYSPSQAAKARAEAEKGRSPCKDYGVGTVHNGCTCASGTVCPFKTSLCNGP